MSRDFRHDAGCRHLRHFETVARRHAGIVQRKGRLSEFYETLEREPEDPEWALPLERELEDLTDDDLICILWLLSRKSDN